MLSNLTSLEQSALNCSLSLPEHQQEPGTKLLKKYGFVSIEQYRLSLKAARAQCRAWLDDNDITAIGDLEFENASFDGGTQAETEGAQGQGIDRLVDASGI